MMPPICSISINFGRTQNITDKKRLQFILRSRINFNQNILLSYITELIRLTVQ